MIRDGITFDDILLVPQYSTVKSRSKVDLSVKLGSLEYKHPIIPANMQTVTGRAMVLAIIESGGLPILHRFMPIEDQLNIAKNIVDVYGDKNIAISIGVKEEDSLYVHKFMSVGVKIFCVDVAHGDSEQCINMVSWLKERKPKPFVIAGNVATGEAAKRLWLAGANVVKVGVGPGSLCTTRIETGNGVPQLTALIDVAQAQKELLTYYKLTDDSDLTRHFPFISDGGIKSAGDIVKALCFADMVMVGNLFAGCVETPGDVMKIDGRTFKNYVGSSTHKTNHVEGVVALVPTKGTFNSVLAKLLEGLSSGCSYQGAHNLIDLKDNPVFIKISNSGLRESHPHDVIIG